MKKIFLWSIIISVVTLQTSCSLYLEEPDEVKENRNGFDEPVTESTDLYDVTYQFNEGVHYIQQEPVDNYILMRDDSIVYYAENTPTELLPHKGEVIYSGFCGMFPEGFAREVIGVEKENGMYKLLCKRTNFDKVFKDLDLNLNVEIDPNQPGPDEDDTMESRASNDIRDDLGEAKIYSQSVDWSFTLNATSFENLKKIYNKNITDKEVRERDAKKKKYGVSYDGNLKFDFTYKVTKSFMLHFNKGKRQFYYKMTDKTEKVFGFGGEGSVAFRFKLSDVKGFDNVFGKKHKLLKLMAGPVPVTVFVTPEVEFTAGIKGSFNASFSHTSTSVSGFYYNSSSDKGSLESPKDDQPWTMKETEGTVGIQAGLYADLNINGQIGLSVAEGLIDGYIKPYLDLEAGLNFDINNKLGDLSKPNNTYFGAECKAGIDVGLAINVPVVDAELFRVDISTPIQGTIFSNKYTLYPSIQDIKVIEDKAASAFTPDYPIFDCTVVYREGWVDIENPRILVYTVPEDESKKPQYVSMFYPTSTSMNNPLNKYEVTQHYMLAASQIEMASGGGIKRGKPYEARFVVTRDGKDYQIGEQYFSTRSAMMKFSSYRQLYGGKYIHRSGESVGQHEANKDKYEYRFRVECLLNAAPKMYNAGYHIEVKDNMGHDVMAGDYPLYSKYPIYDDKGKVKQWNNINDGIRTMEIRLLSNEEADFQILMYPIVYLLKEDGSYSRKDYPDRGISWVLLESNVDNLSSEPNKADIVINSP